MIGEPQRASRGNQFGLTFAVFTHYCVQLWVPEAGGAVGSGSGSEAHDLVMMLFGGMSKVERMRIRTCVRTAVSARAAMQGRFLGGRSPYAYRLTADGITSPSGHDRDRNRHRHGLAWGRSAIRAIRTNPRYTGYQVWAKQRGEEVLLDVEDVSAGHQTIMPWNGEEQWVWSTEPSQGPRVDRDLRAVRARMVDARRGSKPRRGSKSERRYLLHGRLRCSLCGPKLQGNWNHREAHYRCTGTFDPLTRSVEAVADLGVRMVRVGGGNDPLRTRIELG